MAARDLVPSTTNDTRVRPCQADLDKDAMDTLIKEGGVDCLAVKHDFLDGAPTTSAKPKPPPRPPKKEKTEDEQLKLAVKSAHRKAADLALEAARMPEELRKSPGVPSGFVDSMEKDLNAWSTKFGDIGTKLQSLLVNNSFLAADGPAALAELEAAKVQYLTQANLAKKMMKNATAKPKDKAKKTPKGP